MRQQGTNSWHGSGVVISDVFCSDTKGGNAACSFKLAIDEKNRTRVVVRINAYGGNTIVINSRKMQKGDYCIVDGELMNRAGNREDLVEIRCGRIIIFSQPERRHYGREKENENNS